VLRESPSCHVADLIECDALNRPEQPWVEARADNGFEVPKLMRQIRDAIVLEYKARFQLTLRPSHFLFVDAQNGIVYCRERSLFEIAELNTFCCCERHRIKERVRRGNDGTGHGRCEAALYDGRI
jgi:hypothetical protein